MTSRAMTDQHLGDPPLSQLDFVSDNLMWFWRAGASGRLRMMRCSRCAYVVHPPSPVCPTCWCTDLAPEPVSSTGHVYAASANWWRWSPEIDVPYRFGIVELDEQPGLRLLAGLVGFDEDPVVDSPVELRFRPFTSTRHSETLYEPLFQPGGMKT